MIFETCFVNSPLPANHSKKTNRMPDLGAATSDSTRRCLTGRSETSDVDDDVEEGEGEAAKTGAFTTTELPPISVADAGLQALEFFPRPLPPLPPLLLGQSLAT